MSLKASILYRYPYPAPVDRKRLSISYVNRDKYPWRTLSGSEVLSTDPTLISEDSELKWVYSGEASFDYGLSVENLATDGLVLELTMFEGSGTTLYDSSGNGNNGTIYGASWKKLSTGKYALYFDGVDDYVEVPHSPELAINGPLTVEALAYIIDYVNNPYLNMVVTKGSGGSLNYRLGYLTDGWEFRMNVAGDVRVLHVDKPVGRWYHLVGVFTGDEMLFYINNVLESSLSVSGTVATSTEPVRIGWGEASTAPEYFYGYIALVRTYKDYALSESEIKAHCNQLMPLVGGTCSA